MYLKPDEVHPDAPAQRRIWGVSRIKSRETFSKRVLDGDGQINQDAWMEEVDKMTYGDEGKIWIIRKPFFKATIQIQGMGYHLGASPDWRKAAQLYDAALFHCWGIMANPKARFNFPNEFPPVLPAHIFQIKDRLIKRLMLDGYELSDIDRTYATRLPVSAVIGWNKFSDGSEPQD